MIEQNKITATEIAENNVKSNTGTRLTGTVEENKHAFDKLSELIARKHNELIEELVALGVDETVISESFKKMRLNQYGQLEVSVDGEKYVVAGSSHEIQDMHGNIMETRPVLRFSGMAVENEGDATVIYGNNEYETTEMIYSSEEKELVIVGDYYNLPTTFFAKMTTPCSGEINTILFDDLQSALEVTLASGFADLKRLKEGNYYLINRVGTKQIELFDPSLEAHASASFIESVLTLPNNTAPKEDTPTAWEQLGLCKIYYNSNSTITNKPTTYGTLLNIVGTVKVTQLWFRQGYGELYIRSGNATGWNGSASVSGADAWRRLFDSSETIPLENGGLGRNVSNTPPYAIIRATSDLEEYPYVYYEPTTKGVFYATSENGKPKFDTAPISCGGTGATTAADARSNLGVPASSHTHASVRNGVTGAYVGLIYDSDDDNHYFRKESSTTSVNLGGSSWRFKNCFLSNTPNVSSDIRLKENISKDLDKYVKMLDLLEPMTFTWKSDAGDPDRKTYLSYGAQYVWMALKEVGLEEKDFGGLLREMQAEGSVYTYSISPEQFFFILHAKVKKLEKKYDTEIEALEKKYNNKMESLEKEVQELRDVIVESKDVKSEAEA